MPDWAAAQGAETYHETAAEANLLGMDVVERRVLIGGANVIVVDGTATAVAGTRQEEPIAPRTDLTPALLEASLPFSRSGLYRLFEPLGGVRNAILQRRLERSMKTLLTGSAAKPPLRAIARDHGFATEEQFNRSFRTRFGLTPYQFYDLVRRRDAAALAAQAERAGFSNLLAWIQQVTEPGGNSTP